MARRFVPERTATYKKAARRIQASDPSLSPEEVEARARSITVEERDARAAWSRGEARLLAFERVLVVED